MSPNDFRHELRRNGVNINHYVEALIKKNESGDSQSFVTFGKEVFKQIETTENKPKGRFMRSLSPAHVTFTPSAKKQKLKALYMDDTDSQDWTPFPEK